MKYGRTFFKVEEAIFVFQNALGYVLVAVYVYFYSAGVVTHDRWIGSCTEFEPRYTKELLTELIVCYQ
jgi:hypothetical protein